MSFYAAAKVPSVGKIISATKTFSEGDSSVGSSRTWTDVSAGAEPTGTDRRYIIAIGYGMEENPNSYSSITIDGGGDTELVSEVGGTYAFAGMAMKEFPTGTLITVTVNWGNAPAAGGIALMSVITDSLGMTLYDTATRTSSGSFTISTPSRGLVIAGSCNRNGGVISWTGATSLHNQIMQAGSYFSTARIFRTVADSATSISATSTTPNGHVNIAASFKPGP